uniref:Uncharacterized protein n=1 Tax=Tetranychus urticae TaxID=32264 RepID=T1L560_TETUR
MSQKSSQKSTQNVGPSYFIISGQKVRPIPPANEIAEFDRILVLEEDQEVICIAVKIGAESTLRKYLSNLKKVIRDKCVDLADINSKPLNVTFDQGTEDFDFIYEAPKKDAKLQPNTRPTTTIERVPSDDEESEFEGTTILASDFLQEEELEDNVFLCQESKEVIPAYAENFPAHYLSNKICDKFFKSSNIVKSMEIWFIESKLASVALEDLYKKIQLRSTFGVSGAKWSFDKFKVNYTKNGYYQVFLTFKPEPLTDNYVTTIINPGIHYENGWKCIFKHCDCKKTLTGQENGRKHLQRKFVSYVCSGCAKSVHEKNGIYNHLKKKTYSEDEAVKKVPKKSLAKSPQKSHSESPVNVCASTAKAPKLDTLCEYIDYLLNIAREDFVIGPRVNGATFANYIRKEPEAISFISNLATIKLLGDNIDKSQHGWKELKSLNDKEYKIYATKNFAFQIVNDQTRIPIGFWTLLETARKNAVRNDSIVACKNQDCQCGQRYRGNNEEEVIWHYITLNYSLACCGCHKSFKFQQELEKHFTHRDCAETDIEDDKKYFRRKTNN